MAFTVYHYSICQSNIVILNNDVEIEHVNKKGKKKDPTSQRNRVCPPCFQPDAATSPRL